MGLSRKSWLRLGVALVLSWNRTTTALALARGFGFKFVEKRGHDGCVDWNLIQLGLLI
jgi:hypothetical protein